MCKWSFAPFMALLSGVALAGPVEIKVTPEQRSALGIELAAVRVVREAPVAALPAICRLPGDSTVPAGGWYSKVPGVSAVALSWPPLSAVP